MTLPRTPEFTLKNNNRSKSKGNQDTYQELDATTNQPTSPPATVSQLPIQVSPREVRYPDSSARHFGCDLHQAHVTVVAAAATDKIS